VKKQLMRGLVLALFGMLTLGLAGCGADNETTAEQQTKNAGPMPKLPEGADQPVAPKDMNSMEDYAKQRQDPYQGTGYVKGGKNAKPASK
jgi:hypothetical protein